MSPRAPRCMISAVALAVIAVASSPAAALATTPVHHATTAGAAAPMPRQVQVFMVATRNGGTAFQVRSTAGSGAAFNAYAGPHDGLLGVHDMTDAAGEHLYVHDGGPELVSAVKYGFADRGTVFWVPRDRGAGNVGIIRLHNVHQQAWRYVTSERAAAQLVAQGWTRDPGERFHGLPAAPVMPAEPDHGSLPIGQAVYPVPAHAVWVSTTGNDAAVGSANHPVRTLARATALVPSGGTIVLRAGVYHDSVGKQTRPMTIQNAPGEAVWLDGSEVFSSWTRAGSSWATAYSCAFDSGPTFKQGQPDSTRPSWAFVNASHPMAAHPDQVWIDGVAQTQVASAAQVGAGSFYVDAASRRLVLGSNPTGHQVRVATLQQAVRFEGDGSVLRGIGVRNFAPSQYMMGMVISYAQNATFENDEFDGSSTVALGLYRPGDDARHVTVANAGMLGIMGTNDDHGVIDHALVTGSNTEHFNYSPAVAGIKVGRMEGFTLSNSEVDRTAGGGFWTDEDARDVVVDHNVFRANARNAVMLELTARAQVTRNLMLDNGELGSESVFISDTNRTLVAGNIIDGPRAAIRMGQDTRTRATEPNVGDSRTAPDADMTWQTTHAAIVGNVLEDDGAGSGSVHDGIGQDFSNWGVIHGQAYDAIVNTVVVARAPRLTMVDAEDANVISHPASAPRFVIVDQQAGVDAKGYPTWTAWRAAHPRLDAHSVYLDHRAVDADGVLVRGVRALSVAVPASPVKAS